MPIHLKRTATILNPDQSRVLLRPFSPGGPERIAGIIWRVMSIPEEQLGVLLDRICVDFWPRQLPNPQYEKPLFGRKLSELGQAGEFTRRVMHRLGETFALEELRTALQSEQFRLPDGMSQEDQSASQGIWMLARSNYEVQFP